MTSDEGSGTKVGSKSWVPMGAAIAAVIMFVGLAAGGTGWAAHMSDLVGTLVQNDSDRDIREKERDKTTAELAAAVNNFAHSLDKLTEALQNKIEHSSMLVWIANLARLNPTIQVPDFDGGPFSGSGPRK